MVELWLILFFFALKVAAMNFPPVNLHIGTSGNGYGVGNLPLGVQSPYGAFRLGPDTSNTFDIPIIFEHCGGYHYSDKYINAFSHTHMFGAGLQDYGEIGVFPIQVKDDDHLQHMIASRYNYRSTFTHERERAEPGFYQVYLDTHKINVELTATEQVGVHRYSFDKFNKRHRVILVDSSYTLHTKACNQSYVDIDSSKNEITGSILFEGPFSKLSGGVTTYFVITFTNWTNFGVWTNGHLAQGQTTTDGCSSGAYVILPDDQQQVTVYVDISFISIEQAHINLQVQTELQLFDCIRELVQQKWSNEISRFEVSAEWNREAEIKFNTAIVHSLSIPTQWDESNGVYLGFDGQVHTKPDYMEHIYTDLSIWDIFRTQIPFIIFHDSQRANDIIHSIMLNVEQGGDLPKWPFANIYTNCMIGSHADIMLSDMIMKREHNIHLNMTQVIEALRKVANQVQKHDSRFDPPTYIKYQYVPYDMDSESASQTLRYVYDDWAIGNGVGVGEYGWRRHSTPTPTPAPSCWRYNTFGRGSKPFEDFDQWLNELPFKHKLIIGGNHDSILKSSVNHGKFLKDEQIVIDDCLCIYDSSWHPVGQSTWSDIPSNSHTVRTHNPPDSRNGSQVDVEIQLQLRLNKIKPSSIFGHIHADYGVWKQPNGVLFANAASITCSSPQILNDALRFKISIDENSTFSIEHVI
ncbi:unnamed protein product [Rotaria magnacalcarata]|uniref:Uncharacterized protein n=5 Tax=Rotaria magnacalcarata TaxID=392030 RepID=A0A819RI94_9BILA|nr:unnamed protein product [Rotaria magnacalcarata]CAF4048126.1 unnamed protein product [Rotaria magnacalcarata]